MRLADLPEKSAQRVANAGDGEAWLSFCADARAAPWLAWNVRQDAWYRLDDLDVLSAHCATAPAELHGPELLVHIAGAFRGAKERARWMTPDEQVHLPSAGFTHVASSRYIGRYELAAESTWDEGSLPGETQGVQFPVGRTLKLRPRPGKAIFIWVTFDHGEKVVPKDPDDVLCGLGLPWLCQREAVLRLTIPLAVLRDSCVRFALPTIFDVLNDTNRRSQNPDWRARPQAEHQEREPWGYTRHLRTGGPCLPEVLVEISCDVIDTLEAESLGSPKSDWSARHFLQEICPT